MKPRAARALAGASTAAPAADGSTANPPPSLQGLPPAIGPHCALLVLGSFPGVASLQAQQYYGHPRNHFWPLVGRLLQLDLVAMPYAQRLAAAQARGLGLWDVYARCQRVGSLDADIRQAVLNDLQGLPQRAPGLRVLAHNGGESARARRHTEALGLPVLRLPSSSPANASWSFDRKLQAWRAAFQLAGLV